MEDTEIRLLLEGDWLQGFFRRDQKLGVLVQIRIGLGFFRDRNSVALWRGGHLQSWCRIQLLSLLSRRFTLLLQGDLTSKPLSIGFFFIPQQRSQFASTFVTLFLGYDIRVHFLDTGV